MRLVAASVGLCCVLLACGGSGKSKNGSSYQQSKAGLAQLIGDIVKQARTSKTDAANQLAHDLQLDDHLAWFIEHFGTALGKTLAADYDKVAGSVEQIAPMLKQLDSDGFTKIVVERFDKPDDPASVRYQHLALKRMKVRSSLYSVRMVKPDTSRGFHLWSFVYSHGRFRWVGKMTAVADGPDGSKQRDKNELRLREIRQAKAP